MANIKIAIGISNNNEWIQSQFFWNFQALVKPYHCKLFRGMGTIKAISLNEITREALDWGADYIFYMDSDMTFPQDVIPKLIGHNLDIVGGLYHLRKPPFSPVAGWFAENKNNRLGVDAVNQNNKMWKLDYCRFPDGDEKGLVEIDWTGIGCLLVKADVFNKIGWNENKFGDIWSEEAGTRIFGHDIVFCKRVKDAGYKIYIDRTINCAHGWHFYSEQMFIDAFFETDMGNKWVEKIRKNTETKQYWDRIWSLDNIKTTTRIYPQSFQVITDRVPSGSSVADIGCGIGVLLKRLKNERLCNCYGYDISEIAIKKLRELDIPGEVADVRTYQNDGKMFDIVVATHMLEHLENEEKLFIMIKSLMKNDKSRAIVSVPINLDNIEHKRTYTKETFKNLMNKYFRIIETIDCGTTVVCIGEQNI